MEVRLNANGMQPLATKTFFCDEEWFEVASVIVYGKTDAVLIDAQWTLSGAHRLIAEIIDTGKKLKTIYLNERSLFGRGIGARAIALALEAFWARHPTSRVTLHVRRSNVRALACYKRAGFSISSAGIKPGVDGRDISFFEMTAPPPGDRTRPAR